MTFDKVMLLAAGLAAVPVAVQFDAEGQGAVAVVAARAQQMGNDPWNYNRASRGFWANYQAVRRNQQETGGGAGGGGSGAEVIYYYSSSTAIANQQVINQQLGDGATGVIDNNTHQGSVGNQHSDVTSTSTTNNNPATTIVNRPAR